MGPWGKALLAGSALYGLHELYAYANEQSFKSQVVVLTGAASGIGRLLALKLAQEGARLACWDINEEMLESLKKELMALGCDVQIYVVDITDREKVYRVGAQVLQDFGHVDVLINNAGIVVGSKIQHTTDAAMEKTVQVNTLAHFWTLRMFLPAMLKRNAGQVVTVASMAGQIGTAGLVDYSASKFGAVGIAESLRMELRHGKYTGVSSVLICPFFIKTGMFTGASSKYPLLFPLLEPSYAVSQIFQAMSRRTAVLMMPRACYVTPVVKHLLPTVMSDAIMDFFDGNAAMDDFVQTRRNTTTTCSNSGNDKGGEAAVPA